MSVRILIGDVRARLAELPPDSVDCVVTSPPYWGLRDYDVDGQLGMEPTLGEHLNTMVDVFREMRRVMKPDAPFWLNYGDCYATAPNGRSAAATKAAGNDDRTFRDKPFSTVGPIYAADARGENRRGKSSTIHSVGGAGTPGRVLAGGYLKPKDLCLIPFRLAIALQEDGWWVRSRCMWGKPNGMPDSSGKYRPSVAHEEIFLLSKSGDVFYDAEAVCSPVSGSTHARVSQNVAAQAGSTRANGGRKTNGNMKAVVRGRTPGVTPKSADEGTNVRAKGSFHASTTEVLDTRYLRTYEPQVWHIATAAYAEAHFATFPPALVERCLMAGLPKDRPCLVLDPFGGAGTVGLVADRMGHDAILIELNPGYAEQARGRIQGDGGMFAKVEVDVGMSAYSITPPTPVPVRSGEQRSGTDSRTVQGPAAAVGEG